MAQDLYELLDIPENANEPWVRRAVELKRKAIEADSSLSGKKREALLLAVDNAAEVLTNPRHRENYDQELAAAKSRSNPLGRILLWLVVLGLVGGGGFAAYSNMQAREKERIQAEQEELAAAQAAVARKVEMEAKAKKEAERQVEALRAQQNAIANSTDPEYEKRYQASVRARAAEAPQEDPDEKEKREQNAQSAEKRRLQAELDRQRNYVQQVEAERRRNGWR